MPQAVSLFPSPPPQSNSAGASQSNSDTTSTRFDDALKDAQQKESSDATPTDAAPTPAPEKSAKSAKDKAIKGASGKTVNPKTGDTEKNATSKTSAPTVEDVPEEVTPAPIVTDPASETPSIPTKPKIKIPAKPDKAEPGPAVDTNAIQLAVSPLKKPTDSPKRDPRPKADDHALKDVSDVQTIAAVAQGSQPHDASDVEAAAIPTQPSAQTPVPAKSANLKSTPVIDRTPQALVGAQPHTAAGSTGILAADEAAIASSSSSSDDVAALAPIDSPPADTKPTASQPEANHSFAEIFNFAQGPAPANSGAPASHSAAPPRLAPDARFAEANLPTIVTNVHSTLLPNGGSMQIRLNPPELGAMDISVQMRNGTMTATFDTTNDQASRMLSHSLGQLKTALEAQGVTVGALHVQQSPRNSETGSNSNQEDGRNQGNANDASAQQQEQQRKDMLRRMWAKLSGDEDPLDLVA